MRTVPKLVSSPLDINIAFWIYGHTIRYCKYEAIDFALSLFLNIKCLMGLSFVSMTELQGIEYFF